LGDKLIEMKSTTSTIGMDEVKNIIKSNSISIEEESTNTSIRVLHNLGYLLYYPPLLDDISQDLIILDPQWLVNILKSVVTIKNVDAIDNGWLSHTKPNLSNLWPQCKPSIHSFILDLLYRFRISIKSKGQSLIPCRLEQVPQTTINQFTQLIYRLEFPQILPEDLFPTFIASPKVLHYLNLENNTIWRDAVILHNEYEKESGFLFVRSFGRNISLFKTTTNIQPSNYLLIEIISFISLMISNNWSGLLLSFILLF